MVKLINVPLPSDGTYTVTVGSLVGASTTGNYQVTVWDTTPNVRSLIFNQLASGTLSSPYVMDDWNFVAAAGTQIEFNLLNVSGAGASFTFAGPNGWIGFSNLNASSGLVTLPYGGPYSIEAFSPGGQYGISYAFEVAQTAQTNLAIGQPLNGQLIAGGQAQLFLVNVTNPSPMRVSLAVATPGCNVELYAKFGTPPTRTDYDYRYNGPPTQSENILVPEAAAGSWYILVYVDYAPQTAAFSIQAELGSIFLGAVSPTVGGTDASLVLSVTGVGFDSNTVVELASGGSNIVEGATLVSGTQLEVSIASNTLPAGVYNVCVSSGADTDCLTNDFTMVAGGNPGFHADVIVPDVIGYHHPSTFYVEYANSGTASMPAPLLSLTPVQNGKPGAMMTLDESLVSTFATIETAFLQDSYDQTMTNEPTGFASSIQILASGTVPGLLQPGESFRVPVYYAGWLHPWDFSYPRITFQLATETADSADPVDWNTFAATMRPSGLTDTQWNNLLQKLEATLGITWGDYVSDLDNLAQFASSVSGYAFDANQLFTIAFQQASGVGPCGFSGVVIDVSSNLPVANTQVVAIQQLANNQSVTRAIQTDAAGNFAFTNLPAGSYQMFVEGYVPATPQVFILAQAASVTKATLDVSPVPTPAPATTAVVHTNESQPALVVDSAGTTHLTWQRGSEIWHAYFAGTNWVVTGALPGAIGEEPVIASGSNFLDSASPGLMIAWRSVQTNTSTLYYSITRPTTNSAGWQSSSPVMLNETSGLALDNGGLALSTLPNGRIIGVWQKSQTAVVDDTDLYYNFFVPQAALLSWTSNAIFGGQSVRSLDQGEGCVSESFSFPAFDIPSWIPDVGGHYGVDVEAQLCASLAECNYTRQGAESVTVNLGEELTVKGEGEWKQEFTTENSPDSGCEYVPESAELGFSVEWEGEIPLTPWKGLKALGLDVTAQLGLIVGVSGGGSLEWGPHDFSSLPDSASAQLGFTDGVFGKAKAEWHGHGLDLGITGKVTLGSKLTGGAKGIGGEGGLLGAWEGTLEAEIEGEAKAANFGWLTPHLEWQKEISFGPGGFNEEVRSIRSFDNTNSDSGLVITLGQVLGTTNIYEGYPVLGSAATNQVNDGRPALATTTTGATFLAWTMDSDAPSNWIGNSVFVSSLNGTNWSVPIELPNSRGFNSDVHMACDSLGHPMLTWSMANSAVIGVTNTVDDIAAAWSNNPVVYSTFDGATWSEPTAITSESGTVGAISLNAAADGTLIASWVNESSDFQSLYAALWNGSAWSAATLVTTGQVVGLPASSSIGGVPALFWTQDFNYDTNAAADLELVSSVWNSTNTQWSAPVAFIAGNTFTAGTNPLATQSSAKALGVYNLPAPPADCCPSNPPPPPPGNPMPPCTGDCGGTSAPSAGSQDPNAKFGPLGYGPAGYVSPAMILPYTVDFENATKATAPAQQVNILDPLDTNLDWSTFELGELGFGSFIINPPSGSQYFATNVTMSFEGYNLLVQIEAGIDLATGQVFADFDSVDADSDLPPPVNIGFLPPEDGTGRGDGFMAYFIYAKPNLPEGTQITNIAYIQFDFNPVIATDQVDPEDPSKGTDTNKMAIVTIDDVAPTSHVSSLPAMEITPAFTVCWSGSDVGSGIVNYDIYVSSNSGPWTLWLQETTNTCESFTGQASNTYSFYSIARDGAGNVETKSAAAEATTGFQVDNVPPSVQISSPASGARTASPVLSGTASDNVGVAAVNYSISNGNGAPLLTGSAALGVGTTNVTWTIPGTVLAPGTNTLTVQSVDLASNLSAQASSVFFYQVLTPLGVMVAGPGGYTGSASVASDTVPANGAMLNVGEGYTVTAMPMDGALFSGWFSNGVPAGSNFVLNFMMETGLVLRAGFTTNLFQTMAGTYNGWFYETSPPGATEQTAGAIRNFVVTRKRAFSGTLFLAGSRYALNGHFDEIGVAVVPVGRPAAKGGPLSVDLNLVWAEEPSRHVSGTISGADGGWQSAVYLVGDAPPSQEPAAQYTVLLRADPDSPAAPTGSGYLLLVSRNGAVNVTGALADGTPVAQVDPLGEDGYFTLYANLYKNAGLLLGRLNLSETSAGSVFWIKPATAGRSLAGFSTLVSSENSAWTNSASLENLFSNGWIVTVSGGGLDSNIVSQVRVANHNSLIVTEGSDDFVGGSVAEATGRFNLTFRDGGRQIKGQGVLLQGDGVGGGFFIGATNAGSINIIPR